ncbi:MAG: SPOR domain-containing protein [Parabacteroides sp.]|nr:SPOR domain-containing protein [Parabacteroides sp.]
MMMSNSPLVTYTKISPNSTNPRRKTISKITIHHMAGNLSIETCGNVFAPTSRRASSNYGVGTDGRVGMYVEEKNRAWTSSSSANDDQAVTIEVANDQIGGNWHVSDKALNKTIELCVDICKRNGIKKLNFTGDASGNLTMHKWFAATSCPGPYLESKFPYIADEVNKRLNAGATPDPTPSVLYYVQTGAYGVKANADAQYHKVRAAGFYAIMKKSGNLYRVQVGAYSQKANADAMAAKLKAAGFDTYVTTSGGTQVAVGSSSTKKLEVGSKVKINSGADKYSTGQTIPGWVKEKTYTVQQLTGQKALLKEIVSWVNVTDLILE